VEEVRVTDDDDDVSFHLIPRPLSSLFFARSGDG
jgi:hypothetical protein